MCPDPDDGLAHVLRKLLENIDPVRLKTYAECSRSMSPFVFVVVVFSVRSTVGAQRRFP